MLCLVRMRYYRASFWYDLKYHIELEDSGKDKTDFSIPGQNSNSQSISPGITSIPVVRIYALFGWPDAKLK